MHSSRLTNFLLATICILLLWNVLTPGPHAVGAAGNHEYKWMHVSDYDLEKTINPLSQQGWVFKHLTERIDSSQRYILLERDN